MTQVGQTISGEQFNQTYPVGTTLSASEFSNYNKQDKQGTEEGGFAPAIGGIAGNILGTGLGALTTIPTAGVANPYTMGIAGSGAGQAIGQGIQDLIGGKGLDLGRESKQFGVGAAYGAIPGGQEMRALPLLSKLAGNILGRTAVRGGTGYLAGATAQEIQNQGQPQEQRQNPIQTGAFTGALSAISPALPATLGLVSKGVSKLGGVAIESGKNIMARMSIPETNAIQRLFGKGAIHTLNGEPVIAPEVQNIITKYNLPTPFKNWNIGEFKPVLDRASQEVESKLQPILQDPIYSVPYSEVRQIIMENASILMNRKKIPANISSALGKVSDDGTLSQIKDVQRVVREWANWQNPSTEIDKFAMKTYKELGQLIDKQLSKVDLPEYKGLIREHQLLAKARELFRKEMGSEGIMPPELSDKALAETKAQLGLSGERLISLGLTQAPLAASAMGQTLGIPKEVALPISAIASLYGLAKFGPYLNPQAGQQIGGKLQTGGTNVANLMNSDKLQKAFQQLGVRLPPLQ